LKRLGLINQVWGNEIHISYNSNLKTSTIPFTFVMKYEGWNFNSGNYLFTTDAK